MARFVYPIPNGVYADGVFTTLLPLVTKVAVVREYLGYYTVHGSNMTSAVRDYTSIDKSIRSTTHFLTVVERAIAAVNARIAELKLDVPGLELGKNLDYQLRSFALELLNGKPIHDLVKRYAALVPLFYQDDFLGLKHKAILLGSYGVAMGLPLSLRMCVIQALHMPNKLKYRVLSWGKAKSSVARVPARQTGDRRLCVGQGQREP
jgi:hypothetical protein